MINMSCIPHHVSRQFAEKVVETMPEEQKKELGITNEEQAEDAVMAIQAITDLRVGNESDSRREEIFSKPEEFLEKVERGFRRTFAERELEEAEEQYNHYMETWFPDYGRMMNFYLDPDSPEYEQQLRQVRLLKTRYHKVMQIHERRDPKDLSKVIAVQTWVIKPEKSNEPTVQDRAWQQLARLRSLEHKTTGVEITDLPLTDDIESYPEEKRRGHVRIIKPGETVPERWHKTGRLQYTYDGKTIITKSVSVAVHGYNENMESPLLTLPIGNAVDKIGRAFFNKESEIWDNGLIVDDKKLEAFIQSELGGMFTVKGLKNLLEDFRELEYELRTKWGKNIRVFSGDISLFGKQQGSQEWITGKPDLLVVDDNGVVHVLDMKTRKMQDLDDYTHIFHNERERMYGTAEDYGKQVTHYIKMLESYGFKVDQSPYVVLVDTWYSSFDYGPEKNEEKEGRRTVYSQNEQGQFTYNGLTLGEYAESEGNPTQERILNEEKLIWYMEPRMHVRTTEQGDFIPDLAALRDNTDIPFDSSLADYEQQVEALSEEEGQIYGQMAGQPVKLAPGQGITRMPATDLFSNPKLISRGEIHAVSEYMMYKASYIIDQLSKGSTRTGFPLFKNGEMKGRTHAEIIQAVGGIETILDHIFYQMFELPYRKDFPSPEDYKNDNYNHNLWGGYVFDDEEDYQKRYRHNEKLKWLIDPHHKKQFYREGYQKLIALEDTVIPVRKEDRRFNPATPEVKVYDSSQTTEDNGDNSSLEDFADRYLDGLTSSEAWILGPRHYSPRASLAREIRKMFDQIILKDERGNDILDPYHYGFAMHLDSATGVQAVLDTTRNCETMQEMEQAIAKKAMQPEYNWMKQVLETINMPGNENLKAKFYKHFRKDRLNYSICEVKLNKETGEREVITRIINLQSAQQVMTQSLGATFYAGTVGNYEYMEGASASIVSRGTDGKNHLTRVLAGKSTVAHVIQQDILKLESELDDLYRTRKIQRGEMTLTEYVAKQLETGDYISRLTKILHGVGIMMPEAVVKAACLENVAKGRLTSTAGRLLSASRHAIIQLQNMDRDGKIPDGLRSNKAFRYYAPILKELSKYVQEHVESSVYENGKTYYSYTNPSKLGHIIRNLQDALGTLDEIPEGETPKFQEYIQKSYGRFTGWFKTVKGDKWLLDWMEQFTDPDNDSARQALEHKVELAYIGNQYRDLGALGFQLSILHNYFGSMEEQEKGWRWFALPTLSNKPTNEFIRMKIYTGQGTRTYKDEIIDRVLMKTFLQETNRMADVLHHFVHHDIGIDQLDLTEKKLRGAGWTQPEIDSFRDRLLAKEPLVTPEDVIRLQKVTSGAKFHFLWYLNGKIAQDSDLSTRIAARLTTLLRKGNNTESIEDIETLEKVREVIADSMEDVVLQELDEMRKLGIFDKATRKNPETGADMQYLIYQEEFGKLLGKPEGKNEFSEELMEEALEEFIWQDIAANINIIQLTGGDLANYGNAVNYQKRIAQIHSPGWHMMTDERYSDGFFRSMHISDEIAISEIQLNAEAALMEWVAKLPEGARSDAMKMVNVIISGLEKINVTDGQSYSGPTSMRKKLALQGEWDDAREQAYNNIRSGKFDLKSLGILMQPLKPFVTSDLAKYSGSTTMSIRKVPLQDKNSEYLLILAEALSRGAGKMSKMTAIYDFMEATAAMGDGRTGIDTIHFASVGKVGVSGVVNIQNFDKQFAERVEKGEAKEEDYEKELTEYLLQHVRRFNRNPELKSRQDEEAFDAEEEMVRQGILSREETIYNPQYVDTIPVEDYIIQQEVPAHFLENEQLYGSQIRILGISDITPSRPGNPTIFNVRGKMMTAEQLIEEYQELHASNIWASFDDLMLEIGLDKIVTRDGKNVRVQLEAVYDRNLPTEDRNTIFENMETLLQKELSKDSKYGPDTIRACTLRRDSEGNVIDFTVPLFDPIQSRRIQELLNSIIKKTINRQRINGGTVVQTTAYDNDLSIRFQDKKGNLLPSFREFRQENQGMSEEQAKEAFKKMLKEKQAGIAYFECYMSVPDAALERLITREDGSMMSIEEVQKKLPPEVWKSMSEMIGYRIPTEDKYSMVPLKVVGFMPREAGQVVMMPKEITFLTGSDFDIDKMYIMKKQFARDTVREKNNEIRIEDVRYITKGYQTADGYKNREFMEAARKVMQNANIIIRGDFRRSMLETLSNEERKLMTQQNKEGQSFLDWYTDYLLNTTFVEQINQDAAYSRDAREARNNRLIDLQWAVLTNEDTVSKMLNPQSYASIKRVGQSIRIRKSQTGRNMSMQELKTKSTKELEALLEADNPHNTTLPSSKIYFQRQNMQGSQMVGIFANNNVSHAFCSLQKIGIDLHKGFNDFSFAFGGVIIGDSSNPTVLDRQAGLNGGLISKNIASFLAASLDTAKDPTLSDINVNTFTGGVAMALTRMGFDEEIVGLFLSQPVIVQLSDLYFRKRTDGNVNGYTVMKELAATLNMSEKELNDVTGIKDIRVLTKENLWEHLTDEAYDKKGDNFQKRVLTAYCQLFKIARDLQELTFCTKFNSVTNAAGPTIADTMAEADRVRKFIDGQEESVFYIPEIGSDFTSAAEVILNDPILNAFYGSTLGKGGASERIFSNFFPHYFEGFQNVASYFRENYLQSGKIDSTTYNLLLNEYIYYLLTYNNDKEDITPVLPYSQEHRRRLAFDLAEEFKKLSQRKDREPNKLLDQQLGGNNLYVREKDEYLGLSTLIFSSGRMSPEAQEEIKVAWDELITSEDKELRRFATDLFFYTLMRKGFTFDPKTLMHMTTTLVRYNATYTRGFSNYIEGLMNLREIDKKTIAKPVKGEAEIRKFCDQFIRNHANDKRLVPNIDFRKSTNAYMEGDRLYIEAEEGKRYQLDKFMLNSDTPFTFITLTRKVGTKLVQELYKLEENNISTEDKEQDTVLIYRKTQRLGLVNNFIEYDANSNLETSIFSEIGGIDIEDSEQGQSALTAEAATQEQQDEIYSQNSGEVSYWNAIVRVLKQLQGKQAEDVQYRLKLKTAYETSVRNGTQLAEDFHKLLDKTLDNSEKQKVMDKINQIFEKQDKC